ncbi:MAG: M3 family metallopeptidase [Pseudomonadota bacterium]
MRKFTQKMVPAQLLMTLVLALIVITAGCSGDSSEPTAEASSEPAESKAMAEAPADDLSGNPFMADWETPFGVPPFDQIEESHFMPAFREGMRVHNEEIDAIVSNAEPATFDNTIVALDRTAPLLSKVAQVFFNLVSSHTNEELQAVAKEISPLLAKHSGDINLNPELFARVKAVYDSRESLDLTDEQAYMLQRTYDGFVRSGAALDDASKARLNEIGQEISSLTTEFGQNLLKENNAFELVLETEEELAGLPDFLRAQAAEAAKQRDHEGKYVFTLTRSSMTPFLQYSTRRDLREKIHNAWTSRGSNSNDSDNSSAVAKIASLRVERANILGFDNHAQWVLEDRMAETPEKAYAFLQQVWQPALERAKEERADLQAMVDAEGGDFEIAAWDWFHYSEKVRKERYAIDDSVLKPYFELNNVRDGAFMVANRLFGITFTELPDLPKYHPDVQAFEVKDGDGSHLGVFYFDFHPRPSKRGGAWMNSFRLQSNVDGRVRPVIVNNCNFPKGSGGIPTLLSFNDASTLFHEFGHGLHGILSDVTYSSLAGTSGPRDYTEFPAQMMEHWISSPEVLRETARHYETGEPIPEELIEKLDASSKFNQGFKTVEYLSASILDMDWHTLETTDLQEVASFERESLEKMGLIPEIVVRYRSTYFGHIFSSTVGYSSGYYSYIWSEILDSDGFDAFREAGDIYDQELAGRLRENIYSAGGTAPAMDLYVRFRGKEPSIDPLLRNRGFIPAP